MGRSRVVGPAVSIGGWEATPVADGAGFAQLVDGREVAYRLTSGGDGPLIVHSPNIGVPIDLLDEDPMYDRFLRTLAAAGQLVLYDDLGNGSSDGIDPERDHFGEHIEAYLGVLDAIDAEAAWIIGHHAPAIIETIRMHPDRVSGAVLISPLSARAFKNQVELAANRRRRSGAERALDIFPSRADDPAFLEWLERTRRLAATNAESAAKMEQNRKAVERFVAEARPIAEAPPVMLIRRREAMSPAALAWWNGIIPDAECVTIEGADKNIPGLDAGLIAELAVEFITGRPIEKPAQRQLVAVLFTDLVDSTPAAASSGDTVWRSTLDRYEAALQRTIQRHHGTVIKHTGDGALATFPSGSEAIGAAVELRNTTRDLGLEGRTGIHVGEVEQRGGDIGGIAVHLAARVMGQAEPGSILVTPTVVQSSLGSRHDFTTRGRHELKGIDLPWELFAVELHHG
jgi:class 3 adenylate cyclase